MPDPRIPRCMDRAASVLPWLRPADLDAVVRAVLGEVDDYETEQETEAFGDDEPMPTALPAWTWKLVDELVPPDAVWDGEQGAWAVVAANPVCFAGERLVTYEGGIIARHRHGDQVPVAHNLSHALAWNREHAGTHPDIAPSEQALADIQDLDSDAADRRDSALDADWRPDDHGGWAA